jgi:hypothetical protein
MKTEHTVASYNCKDLTSKNALCKNLESIPGVGREKTKLSYTWKNGRPRVQNLVGSRSFFLNKVGGGGLGQRVV